MTTSPRKLTPEIVRRLTLSAEPWLSCDACFEAVDGYVELLLAGASADAPEVMPALRAHLSGCSACFEEARSLLLLVAAEDNLDPGPALRRLEGT